MATRLAQLIVYVFILITVVIFFVDLVSREKSLQGTADAAKYGLPLSVVLFVAFYCHCKQSK